MFLPAGVACSAQGDVVVVAVVPVLGQFLCLVDGDVRRDAAIALLEFSLHEL